MTSLSAFAYGRAATTRSCARFIFDVATISIVRVILRVFSTDLMRRLSSRPLAISGHPVVAKRPRDLLVSATTHTAQQTLRSAEGDSTVAEGDSTVAADD